MTLDLTLTTMSNGADAIGRHEGKAIFVPFAIPGETVRVEIVEDKPTFARAKLIEVIAPSPDRVTPVCKHFGVCGGCQWQHISYEAQLKWKKQVVIDQLFRIGGITSPNVLDTIPSPSPLHYRNHVQFSQTEDGKLGFMSSAGVVPISECHIAHPDIMALFNQLDIEKLDVDRIGVRVTSDEAMIVFESESGEPPDVEIDLDVSVAAVNKRGEALTMIGSDHLVQTILGRDFRISAASFFQVNTAQAETLIEVAITALGVSDGDTVLDLYCGAGLFTAFIAEKAARVIGVESYESAVGDAEVNLNEFNNVELFESPAEMAIDHLVKESVQRVILDPPRAGCDKRVLDALIKIAPQRIVYVSCDAATLARDAKRLIGAGYKLESATPLDMFPQTHHIEIIAIFNL
ncbi:MAG: class I SAM-dependent RNA methyltransferase [Chloroflexota bacterium]